MISDDFGFIILCPSVNIGGLRTTISTIKTHFPKSSYICAIEESNKDKSIIKEPLAIGKSTITSLINNGIKESKSDWNCVLMTGSVIRYDVYKKYARFVTSENDIIYPIVSLKTWRFEESSLNGFFLHKKTFNKVGNFSDESSLEVCRVNWATKAIEKGYKLKGIVGIKIC